MRIYAKIVLGLLLINFTIYSVKTVFPKAAKGDLKHPGAVIFAWISILASVAYSVIYL